MSSQEPPKKKSKQVENKQGTLLSWVKPCNSDTEPGSNCLANFPRTISQTSSLFRQSQHKRKIRDKNKRYCRQNKCSDLTCTKKYALTEGPKREGELMWATRSAPPVILCLLRACSNSVLNVLKWIRFIMTFNSKLDWKPVNAKRILTRTTITYFEALFLFRLKSHLGYNYLRL